MRKLALILILLSSIPALWGCNDKGLQETPVVANNLNSETVTVQTIPLAGPMKAASAEVSGMAIYADHLVLLPQYPDLYAEEPGKGALFTIPLAEIEAFLMNEGGQEALRPELLPLEFNGLPASLPGYEGFEAIAFQDDMAFLTIETKQTTGMLGYLVRGELIQHGEDWKIVLNTNLLQEIMPQTSITNMTDEAILIINEQVYTFYEANGISVNPEPIAHRFDFDLNALTEVSTASVPFRLTDVSTADSEGNFWAMNYFYPGDTSLLGDFSSDPLSNLKTEDRNPAAVERIISLNIDTNGNVQFGQEQPLSLALLNGDARNWEGLVYWPGKGFLIITDKFPGTILGFVPYVK